MNLTADDYAGDLNLQGFGTHGEIFRVIQRQPVPEGTAIAKALDYILKRWTALTRYLDEGAVPIDNNWAESQIRPWALGRSNWLVAGLFAVAKGQQQS